MKRIRIASAGFLVLILSACGSLEVTSDDVQTVTVMTGPVTVQDLEELPPNTLYPSNRAPLVPSPFARLPIGAVKPHGWLRGQLERMAEGMTGRLPEISAFCKAEGNAWLSPEGDGHSPWEELPYWLKGFGDLGYVLGDRRIIDEARVWIDGILSSQDGDGWFGPRRNKERHDIWPNMVALNCLQSFYEATGDERVLPFMTRYCRFLLDMPRERLLPGSWQKIRGGDNLESIYWLYNRTGDGFLLDLARAVHERTADWSGGVANWHGVNICQGFREPAEYFMQAKDPVFRDAAYRNYETVMGLYGRVPGGMFGADENCRRGYSGPRQAAETCSMVEFMHSFEMLLRITGDPLWADRCEEVAFNSLPAAMTPDLKALHYLTAPNMVQLDGGNKSPGLQNRGCMLAYTPHRYRCCQHNVSHGWPYYAEELWLAAPGNGLLASLYAPCTVTALAGDGGRITIREQTDYPFGDTVRFSLSCGEPMRFPLYLRIPRWCAEARVSVNGRIVEALPEPLSYVQIERTWKDGDRVDLVLPMSVNVSVWEEHGHCVSVSRGPLAYSLEIGERWKTYGGDEEWQDHEKADLKSTPEWPAYEVFADSPWNYGLVLDTGNPASSFEVAVAAGPIAAQPFTREDAPVKLRAKARRIPGWRMEDGLVGRMQPGPVRSDEPEETVALIPMGCARLRIAAIPVIATAGDAREWTVAPEPRASHCFEMDTVRALCDGLEPASSGDREIPRMTWWDHRGTAEWVAYDFEKPRVISFAEVYWFDDTGAGHCRIPESWRLVWSDGREWRPVKALTPYATDRDGYNRVEFEPVEASSLRLEVQLREGYSGGILEWRAGGAE